jgi:two-component system, chemotaxis family, CheB/CheR fusion protein
LTSFPTVAIGSSAGGLEALSELLETLPLSSATAFIIVQHLAPEHESLLAELLAKKTTMWVQAASDGVAVQPDCVYVIPPNATITVTDDRLQLRPRDRDRPHHPVDILFVSLAEAAARVRP